VDPYFEGDIEDYRSIDILDPRFTDYCRAQVATPERRCDPDLVPQFLIRRDLPPLLVHDGDADTLHAQIQRSVADARAAGVEVDYETYPDMFHVFQIALGAVPEAATSLSDAAGWLRERVKPGPDSVEVVGTQDSHSADQSRRLSSGL